MPKSFAPDAQTSWLGLAERLALFLLVAETTSFSAAARQRGLAPSSVARQIDLLEAEVGARLFNRSTRRLTLTEAGAVLVERGTAALRALDEARGAVSSLQTAPRGHLRVAAPAAFGQRHVVPMVAAFLATYPEIELELMLEDRMVDLIEERIDLAVRIGEIADSSLVALRLAPQRRVACAAPSYLARRGTPARPEDLREHACLTMPGAPLSGWWSFGREAPVPVRGPFVSRSTEALLRAAIDGAGIVHLATWLVGEAVRAGALVRLFPEQTVEPEARSLYLLRPPGSVTPKARAFMDAMRGHIGAPPYWDAGLFV